MPIARPCSALLAGLFLLLASAGGPRAADAANRWSDLTGRKAPDLTFAETAQGLEAGTRLSSFRGKEVVLLAFWLRDCRHCKRELPRVQALHARWARSGLQVVSIVHDRYPLTQITPVMKERGWTFPVARDVGGKLADRYGGGRRPGFYVVGIDGRVKGSIGLSERIVLTELARWRLHELERDGRMPKALEGARDQVKAGAYGVALRLAEAEARKAGASADVRAAAERLKTLAGRKMQNRVERAQGWHKQGKSRKARAEYDAIVKQFAGTSLEAKAKSLRDAYVARGDDS